MKVFAVTVVYEPDPELLLRSVVSYAGWVERVIVWRNSPLPADLEARLQGAGPVVLRGDGTNVGISVALNKAWREAAAEGADALLTMDQDSVWHDFPAYLAAVTGEKAPEGFFCPAVNPDPAPVKSGKPGQTGIPEQRLLPRLTAFTSGMLIPLQVLDKVGGWCEDFKVDGVDNEFCLHARSLGVGLYQASCGSLEHRLGKVEKKRFLGLAFRVYNYSPERLYGIYRNNLAAIRKYRSVSAPFEREFRRTWFWRRPLRILLGEGEKTKKFIAIFRGIRDSRHV